MFFVLNKMRFVGSMCFVKNENYKTINTYSLTNGYF